MEIQRVGISNVRGKLRTLPDVVVSYTVDGFARTQARFIVDKAKRVAALGHACQLSAALPAHRPAAVAQGIAYAVVAYCLAIVRGEQVSPFRVTVGIGSGRSAAADRTVARAGVLCAAEDIAAVVVCVVPLADEGQRFAIRGCDALVPICHIAFFTCIYIDKGVGLHFTGFAATHEFHW